MQKVAEKMVDREEDPPKPSPGTAFGERQLVEKLRKRVEKEYLERVEKENPRAVPS